MKSRSRKLAVGIAIAGIVLIVAMLIGRRPSSLQIIGHLTATDASKIERIAQYEMRTHIEPYWAWDWDFLEYYGRRPKQLLSDIKEYRAHKILWAEVQADGSVRVFMGTNKNTIRINGYSVTCWKRQGKWESGGWTQWVGGPGESTSNINIPPDQTKR